MLEEYAQELRARGNWEGRHAKMLSLHNAGEPFDFYVVAPNSTYELPGHLQLPGEPILTAAQFGNFIAGFAAGVTDGLEIGTVKEYHGKYVSRTWVVAKSHNAYDAVRFAGNVFDEEVPGWGDSPDAGTRRGFATAAGEPVRGWGERGFTARTEYDALRRPTHVWVDDGATEKLVERMVYGESHASRRAPTTLKASWWRNMTNLVWC